MRRAVAAAVISALVTLGQPASQSFAATHACSGGGSITVSGTRVTSQSGCTGVVRVPDGVTAIDTYVFDSVTTISNIILPASLNLIDGAAFSGATGLTAITFLGDIPSIQRYAFRYLTAKLVYNPDNSSWLPYLGGVFGLQVVAGRTVTFHSNGAQTGDLPAASVIPYFAPGAQITMPENSGALTNGALPFVGWNTENDGTGGHYESGETFTVGSENANLYATWGVAASTADTPALSGTSTAEEGELSFAPGSWTGVPTPELSYQWYACTNQISLAEHIVPAFCSAVDGANGTTFDPSSEHVGKYIAATVIGQSAGTSATTWITATSTEVILRPQASVKPGISGTLIATVAGTNTLNAYLGEWTGYPTPTLTKQWYACTSYTYAPQDTVPTGCTAISGAIGDTLNVIPEFANKFISIAVQAESEGTSPRTWWSATTTRVEMKAAATTKPSITGTARVGRQLTANKGMWTGAPTPNYTYQWYSCGSRVTATKSAVPGNCTQIAGATGLRYTLKAAQRNKFVTIAVTATSGSTTPTMWVAISTLKVA